jgi:hypothetical protein
MLSPLTHPPLPCMPVCRSPLRRSLCVGGLVRQAELMALARDLAPTEALLRELHALREENYRLRHMY